METNEARKPATTTTPAAMSLASNPPPVVGGKPAMKPARKPRTKPEPKPATVAKPAEPKPATESAATKPEAPPSLIGGKPVTLRRLMAAAESVDLTAPGRFASRGRDDGLNLLRDLRLASKQKLQPGAEPTGWIVRTLLLGGSPNVKRAASIARGWADAMAKRIDAGGLSSDMPKDWILSRIADVAAGKRGLAKHYDADVRWACAVAYVAPALAFLPDYVLDAPIPDALRETGLSDRLLAMERAASA